MKDQVIGYDNVCGLAAVCKNPCRSTFSEGAKLVSKLKFVHDRLHLQGHRNLYEVSRSDLACLSVTALTSS